MRKTFLCLSLAVVAAAGVARAEIMPEPIPADFIQQFAPLVIDLVQQQIPNPPVKVEANAEKALGYHFTVEQGEKELLGVVAMPDKNLTAATVEKATDKGTPVGVLGMKSLSLVDKEDVFKADRLAVAELNGIFKMPVFFLSVKGSGADRTLEIYSKDGKALVSAPLKKQASDAAVPLNLKISNIDAAKKKADLTISLGGAYESTVKVSHFVL